LLLLSGGSSPLREKVIENMLPVNKVKGAALTRVLFCENVGCTLWRYQLYVHHVSTVEEKLTPHGKHLCC
jgi:hypothetical protein